MFIPQFIYLIKRITQPIEVLSKILNDFQMGVYHDGAFDILT